MPRPFSYPYSPECVEEAFSEVGIAPVLCQAAFLCAYREVPGPTSIKKPVIYREGPARSLYLRAEAGAVKWIARYGANTRRERI